AWTAEEALIRYLDSGAPPERISVSSDAGGCLACFDEHGRMCGMGVGESGALLDCLNAVLARGVELERALPAFTLNPARLLRLPGKGVIAAGADADLVALDANGAAFDVFIAGRAHLRDGAVLRRGNFEA
ncbi:amidohydrolase family protein, partial [Lysobacter sp. 2RAB21]